MKTSYQGKAEKCARAMGTNMPISHKVSYEIANALRGKDVDKAIRYLEDVIAMKRAIPFKRYNRDVGHKPGKMGAGRYPIKASKHFLHVLKGAKSNAADKALNVDSLVIVHIAASKGAGQWHYGRQRRRQMKATNLDIVVEEVENKKPAAKKVAKVEKKEPPKAKVEEKVTKVEKPEVKTETPKTEKADVKPVEKVKAEDKVEEKSTEKAEGPRPVEKVEAKTEDSKVEKKVEEKSEVKND